MKMRLKFSLILFAMKMSVAENHSCQLCAANGADGDTAAAARSQYSLCLLLETGQLLQWNKGLRRAAEATSVDADGTAATKDFLA